MNKCTLRAQIDPYETDRRSWEMIYADAHQ